MKSRGQRMKEAIVNGGVNDNAIDNDLVVVESVMKVVEKKWKEKKKNKRKRKSAWEGKKKR